MLNTVTAHDYKETLQQLYTNLEYIIVNDARNMSETGKTNIKRAQSALQKMNLLTDDINLYFNLYDMEVEMTELDLGHHVQEVITRLQPRLDQINGLFKQGDLPVIVSHPLLLSQLLRSLIDNAIKYRNVSEQLVIEINYSVTEELEKTAAGKNISYGSLSITDNGMGVEDGHAGKIFDLFYKIPGNGNNRGNGIGLALCKKIMSLHGGFITVSANPARGSKFNCYFPLSTHPAL